MKSYRASAWLLSASMMVLSGPAFAQEGTAAQADTVTTSNQDIVITGSRIVRDGYTAPTPVTVATTEDLAKATPTNIPDALNKLPQFQNSSSPARSSHNFANSASHGNVLNLRGVGGNRTLILFDGIRVPPTTYQGTVDTNVIPSALLQRVDIVTAGASAAYGSDAVAGVVNFVLNRKFTGISGTVQGGIAQEGDNRNEKLSLAGGFKVGDRGHLLLGVDYYNNRGMLRSDRSSAAANYVYVGANAGSAAVAGSAGNPFALRENIHLIFSSDNGKILDGPFANYQINNDGTLRPFDNGTATGTAGFNIGGDGFVIPADVHAVAPLTTYQTFGRFDYELGDGLNAFVQGNFTRSDLSYRSQSNAWTGTQNAPVFEGNPYIPSAIAAALAPGQQFNIGKYSGDSDIKPTTKERTDFWMVTAGLEGEFGAGWKWSVNYNHSNSKHSVDQSGLYDYQKAYAALDAVTDPGSGNIVCRPTLSADPAIRARFAGCQPLNIFLTGNAYSQQAGYAYATGTMSYDARIKQDQAAFQFQGSPFELPAGPVDIVIGAEWRKQKLNLTSNSDPSLLDTAAERNAYFAGLRGVSSASLFYWLTNVGQAAGSVTVKEVFGEINVPIFKDTAFFHALDLNAAGRVTDYSTSGRVETWKLGLQWKPISELTLRGTISRDIRAPTLFDLFAGDQSGIGLLTDPVTNQTGNVSQVSGGNPLLKPEIAKTFTYGFVAQPSFLPGFSLSVDYFDLKIDGAIGTLGVGTIVNNCFANASAPECALITRPSPTAFPTLVRVAAANIAKLETAGIDIDATYTTRLSRGTLQTRLYASWLDKYVTQQSILAPALDSAGYGVNNGPIARPKWRGTLNLNYAHDSGLSIFVSQQYIGRVKVGSREPNNDYGGARTPIVLYTDLTVGYKLDVRGVNLEPFLTINNLFNRSPPLVAANIPGVNLPTIISTYDTVGRAFTAGVRFKF